MVDRTNWDQWKADGEKTFRDRAADVIAECISNYDLEPLDQKMHTEIRTLFQKTANDKDVRLPAFE
jgi:trimethylamine:corrinoid methyltransferase-like protein